jgi:hypothetical protein
MVKKPRIDTAFETDAMGGVPSSTATIAVSR